ncbi:MAG: cytochrome c [Verrucomicrobiota bacterium]
MKPFHILGVLFLCFQLHGNAEQGKAVFAAYCASCHGPEGAGLIGPNLTDAQVLHGSAHEQIRNVIANGIPSKAMPAWSAILSPQQIEDVTLFVESIMGLNLPSPVLTGESSVTPFPQGTLARPLLMRTFMPKLELEDEVFAHHYTSRKTPKYKAKTGIFNIDDFDLPIDGLPGAIAVNFGEKLSYCFDTTECRLLYAWSGGFMDMTNYWGEGSGNRRKKFGYIGELLGPVSYMASGPASLSGEPKFKGYRKVNSIPEFLYSIDGVEFTLRIEPGEAPGDLLCHYTSRNWKGKRSLQFTPEAAEQIQSNKGSFKNGTLTLKAKEAASFTLSIKANS